MSLETAAQIAASVATFIALCLVAWQLRLLVQQNRIETNSALITWERDLWSLALQNPAIAPGITQSLWGGSEAVFATMLIDEFENAFLRSRNKAYDRQAWKAHERYIVRCLTVPQIRQVWQDNRDIRPPDFLRHFDGLIAAAGPSARAGAPEGPGA